MDIEVLLFDGFDELDAVGPFEVFGNAARDRDDVTVRTVTNEPAERVTASHGLVIEPDGTLGEPDLLVVPGGGWHDGGARREYDEGTLPAAIAERHRGGSTVASVCTGAMLLAGGGLLDGRPATTHHGAHADLEAVTERVDARVVDDGDLLTAGGVTSGLDMALWVVEREFGRELADRVARELEYERRGDVYRTAAAG
ncbi:MAG: DJ-1/PfpI family protein [Halobacteriales archaeon]|nr:DJ-1/PfpI family protein [Halobacteriales archaeon]